jgi:hypothetical protein
LHLSSRTSTRAFERTGGPPRRAPQLPAGIIGTKAFRL